jgi:hypothetical protein
MQLLRIILIVIIVYYVLKFIGRYLLPIILKSAIKKVQHDFQQQHQPAERNPGEIKVEYSPKKKSPDGELGEYIDYEEIKD